MRTRISRRSGTVAAIIGLALGAVYLALFTYTRIDDKLFPGSELTVPNVSVAVPGTNIGVNVSLPGVSGSGPTYWTPAARINILVLGLDRRPWEPESSSFRSDTMFVASIDTHANTLQMLAIPRDMWAKIPYGDVPGVWAENKINAAYAYGQVYKYPGLGPAASVAAVEHNFNIDIHHYVVIDWVGFVSLIDAMGGIDVNVPEPISDFNTDVLDAFPNNTVEPGLQHMDGERALGYSRVRTDGDLKRIDRQQIIIRAVASKAVSLGYLTKIPELWSAYNQTFRTDVDNALIPGYALLGAKLGLENIETFSLGETMYGALSEDGQLILVPNRDEMYGVIDSFLADPQLRAEAPVVAVSFAPGMEEQAENARTHLETYGVPYASILLAPETSAGTPGIFDVTGKKYTAAKMTGIFDLRLLNPEGEMPKGADIVIRLGPGTLLKAP